MPTSVCHIDHFCCIQAVTRRVWAAWVVARLAVRNVHVATDCKEPSVSVRIYHLFTEILRHTSVSFCDFLLKRFSLLPCADIDECSERAIACPGLNEACINEEGSFHCDCADGFIRRDSICVENKPPGK